MLDRPDRLPHPVWVTDLAGPQPLSSPPPNGRTVEIEPGVLWLRLALPFRLNHVNVYLVEDRDGWLLVDTGPGDAATVAAWTRLLDDKDGPLKGKPITRIVATHFHPDHVGAAAFLCGRTGAALLMSEVEYLTALNYLSGDAIEAVDLRTALYRSNGASPGQCEAARDHVARYRSLVPALPAEFVPLRSGDRVEVGDRQLAVLETRGHAPAQIVLHEAASNLLFVADQVMTRISPNVGIMDRSPHDDPLQLFLNSLTALRGAIPDGGLVLPGHHLPFRTLHARIDELKAHHAQRCDTIEEACQTQALTAGEFVAVLFPFELDPHQFWFAFSEVLAHLNFMARRGRIEQRTSHGRVRWGRPRRTSHSS
jgi:glyoxylase-like metal-dependent hydrolase (beta-lactamase superfamily II)